MPTTFDIERFREKLATVRWNFTLTIGGEEYPLRVPTPAILERLELLAAGKGGDLFKLAADVLERPLPAGANDANEALAVVVGYAAIYSQWTERIVSRLVKIDPGMRAVLAVMSPAAGASSPVSAAAAAADSPYPKR
jgi:hypothetical protein